MIVVSRVTKWVRALQTFVFAIEVIAGKENLVALSLSRIPWRFTLPSCEASHHFVELLDAESESASEVGSEPSLNLFGIDTLKQQQSKESDIAKLQHWIASETLRRREELQAATPFIRTMAKRLSQLDNVDSLVALRAEDGSYNRSSVILIPAGDRVSSLSLSMKSSSIGGSSSPKGATLFALAAVLPRATPCWLHKD